jgi:hypothetical protein
MSNTLTNLLPNIYAALDTVSREQIGFTPAVYKDAQASSAVLNQTVRIPITPSYTASDITAAAYGPSPSASTFTNNTLTLNRNRSVTFFWEADEQGYPSYTNMLQDQFAQSFRTLSNSIESDLAGLYVYASRGYGTAGTNPFDGTNLDGPAQVRKILEDNGAPTGNMRLIINTAAAAKARQTGYLVKANEAGSATTLRTGAVGDVLGLQIGISAQVKTHTAGTGSGITLNGDTTVADITIDMDGGSGTILAGDALTIGTYTNYGKYICTTALGTGVCTIGAPGAMEIMEGTQPSDSTVTLSSAYVANMAFDQNAIVLATRVPAMPQGGDSADDVAIVTDPISGLSFQVAQYRQYRRVSYEVGIAWGVCAVKPAHIAILLG